MHKRSSLAILLLFSAVFLLMLGWVFFHRMSFPLDVEWMEGGMLMHAVRLTEGKGLYVPPSTEFVPYFYTPGYPAVVGLLGKAFGVSYGLGRFVSVASWLGSAYLIFMGLRREADWRYGVLGVGIFAALFRTNGAFYDVARPDSLFLFFVFSAMYVTRFRASVGGACCAGLLCALGFLTKQTASVFFVAVCVVQFTRSWRHGLASLLTGLGVALAGCGVFNHLSDGWFWTYIFEGHQGHVFIWNNVLLEYWRDLLFLAPALLLIPLIQFTHKVKFKLLSLVLALHWSYAFWVRLQSLDYGPHMYYRELWYETPRYLILIPPLVLAVCAGIVLYRLRGVRFSTSWIWLWFFVAGCGVSGLNHSTQWAYSNCFMPISIVASVLIALTVRDVLNASDRWASRALVLGLSVQFSALAYSPQAQVPTEADWLAYSDLSARLSNRPGETFIPSSPFLSYQVSGTFHTHRMGIQDVAFLNGVKDLHAHIRDSRFNTIILGEGARLPGLERHYFEVAGWLPKDREVLRMKTGYLTRLNSVWFPRYSIEANEPPNSEQTSARALAPQQWLTPDTSGTFETRSDFLEWTRSGKAFRSSASVPYYSWPLGRQGKYVLKSLRSGRGTMSIGLKSQADSIRGVTLLLGGRCARCNVSLVDTDGVLATVAVKGSVRSLYRTQLQVERAVVGSLRLVLTDDDSNGVLVVDDIRLIFTND
jgi:hypothetical protein